MIQRIDIDYLFDCKDGNPNGDPDAGNAPRLDPQDMCGIVTDVCLKRKVRDYVMLAKPGSDTHRIYVQHHGVLELNHKEAYNALGITAVEDASAEGEATETKGPKGKAKRQAPSDVQAARKWICSKFYDVRAFGAVMSTKLFNAGQVRGPVQFGFSRSIDPILPLDICITRVAVANEKEKQSKDTTMGRKNIIPYGLYRCHIYVSAHLAEQTGFTQEDLDLLLEALKNMFEHDRSSSRGGMAAQKLTVFKHTSPLGNAPAHKLFERVKVQRKPGVIAARSIEDYNFTIDKENLPQGVEIVELL